MSHKLLCGCGRGRRDCGIKTLGAEGVHTTTQSWNSLVIQGSQGWRGGGFELQDNLCHYQIVIFDVSILFFWEREEDRLIGFLALFPHLRIKVAMRRRDFCLFFFCYPLPAED